MIPTLSILKLTSAMAHHAASAHGVAGENISRADIPGATEKRMARFSDLLRSDGGPAEPLIEDTGGPISLDRQMAALARSAGAHDTATTIYAKTIDLVRIAGGAPR